MTLQTPDTNSDRDEHGRFVNHPGPGRPRRQIEGDYQRTMADIVTLDRWRAIVERAVTDAEAGDKAAREFIATRLIGSEGLGLTALAIRDLLGISADEEIAAAAAMETKQAIYYQNEDTALQAAIKQRADELAELKRVSQEREQEQRRAERRAEREARKALQAGTAANQ